MVSPLGKAIEFFRDFGLFDIVLPFLLVFTIIFAVLEKTKILGTVKTKDGTEIPNKNLNSMAAFVIALLTVATANVVRAINESLPNIVLLLVISISFLILIGVFMKTEELDFSKKHKGWYRTFMILLFIGVILIFLNSIYTEKGDGWLELLLNFIIYKWSGPVFSSILLLIIIVAAIVWVTKTSKEKKEES